MNNICVFCGSSAGKLPIYKETAIRFGKLLAQNNVTLVYGGGRLGLMGLIADAVLGEGGKVIGVIPEFMMDKEVAHNGITELRIVRSMHERKYEMASLSDAFAVLIVNIYYESLLLFLDSMVENGFLRPRGRELLIDRSDEKSLFDALKNYVPGPENIWDSIKRG